MGQYYVKFHENIPGKLPEMQSETIEADTRNHAMDLIREREAGKSLIFDIVYNTDKNAFQRKRSRGRRIGAIAAGVIITAMFLVRFVERMF